MATRSGRTIVRAERLYDGTGSLPVQEAAVAIEADRIAAVGEAARIDAGPADRVIDLGDLTLLPGLIDAHVHLSGPAPTDLDPAHVTASPGYRALSSAAQARALLHAGFTAVREVGSETGVALARAIDDGAVEEPAHAGRRPRDHAHRRSVAGPAAGAARRGGGCLPARGAPSGP